MQFGHVFPHIISSMFVDMSVLFCVLRGMLQRVWRLRVLRVVDGAVVVVGGDGAVAGGVCEEKSRRFV